MSFLSRLFGEGRQTQEKGLAEHMEYLNSLRQPALGLGKSEARRFSKIGGLPNLPPAVAWPQWKGTPLAFLCQLDLSDLTPEYAFLEFPRTGCLYFWIRKDDLKAGRCEKCWMILPCS